MKISVQTGEVARHFGNEAAYRMIKEAGFEAVDWNLDHAIAPDDIKALRYRGNCIFEKSPEEIAAYWKPELSAIREAGLLVSQAHAVFPEYVTGHPEVTDWAIEMCRKTIAYLASEGLSHLVVHGISLSDDDKENTPESIRKLNLHLYESLIPSLAGNDVVVCLENLFTGKPYHHTEGCFSDPHEAVWFIDYLNEKAGRKAFCLCLDTGHMNLLHKDMRSYIRILGKRIECLHIHDNCGNEDNHRAPFSGSIDWRAFCDSLKEIGYEGNLNFETFMQEVKGFEFDPELSSAMLRLVAAEGEAFRRRIMS